MDKQLLFNEIQSLMLKALYNMIGDNNLLKYYQDNHLDFTSDIHLLKRIMFDELNDCNQNIVLKEPKYLNDDKLVVFFDTDCKKYNMFVLLPIFNASDSEAEKCIYSIIDNFIDKDYKLLIMSNRDLDIFHSLLFQDISYAVFRKNIFSLPEAYTTMISYAKNYANGEDTLISLMDDDAYILSGQNDKIDEAIKRLKEDKYLLTSGHYYDFVPPTTSFQHIVNVSQNKDFSRAHQRPYCHGGASFMIKLKNFPELTTKGLGGISVNILTLQQGKKYDYWPFYNDTSFEVYHPRKNTLFAWIATYLSYEIAWKNAFDLIDEETLQRWKAKLKESSQDRVNGLFDGLKNPKSRIYYLGNLYLTRYLKPLLKNNLDYSEFKKYKISTHINLR